MGSPFLNFALGRSHLPENSILYINRPIDARFSYCCNSLNFEAKINFNATLQNDFKWRKTCIGLNFDLEHFNGPQTKFIGDSLYKHPVFLKYKYISKVSTLDKFACLYYLFVVNHRRLSGKVC